MTEKELNDFFKRVEKKSFLLIKMTVKNEDDSFDILQDSMIAFVNSYREKSEEEAAPLFYRIVQNKIKDWQRKQILTFKIFSSNNEEMPEGESEESPLKSLKEYQFLTEMQSKIDKLSQRQKEVFLLKVIEEFTFKEIAEILKSSEGTIKTHYKRGIEALKLELGEKEDE